MVVHVCSEMPNRASGAGLLLGSQLAASTYAQHANQAGKTRSRILTLTQLCQMCPYVLWRPSWGTALATAWLQFRWGPS